MLDRVMEITPNIESGYKNKHLSADEEYFTVHFLGGHVIPSILQAEIFDATLRGV